MGVWRASLPPSSRHRWSTHVLSLWLTKIHDSFHSNTPWAETPFRRCRRPRPHSRSQPRPSFARVDPVDLPPPPLAPRPPPLGRGREISKFDTQFDDLSTFNTQFVASFKFDTQAANSFKKRDSPRIILFSLKLTLFSHVRRPKYPWVHLHREPRPFSC
jgi:hypothetical protein